MTNQEIEDFAIQYVLQLEELAHRKPSDTRKTGDPVDIVSPPRLIEVKAFGKSARGKAIPLEQRQVDALHQYPDRFYLYVVDNVERAVQGHGEPQVMELNGSMIAAILARTKPTITYWPTLRVTEYDNAPRIGPPTL